MSAGQKATAHMGKFSSLRFRPDRPPCPTPPSPLPTFSRGRLCMLIHSFSHSPKTRKCISTTVMYALRRINGIAKLPRHALRLRLPVPLLYISSLFGGRSAVASKLNNNTSKTPGFVDSSSGLKHRRIRCLAMRPFGFYDIYYCHHYTVRLRTLCGVTVTLSFASAESVEGRDTSICSVLETTTIYIGHRRRHSADSE